MSCEIPADSKEPDKSSELTGGALQKACRMLRDGWICAEKSDRGRRTGKPQKTYDKNEDQAVQQSLVLLHLAGQGEFIDRIKSN